MINKKESASENLERLRENEYPGRGIICGLDESGKHLIQTYWIMGRSEHSRNRIFVFDEDDGLVKTKAADPDLVKDPSLIIYTAMCEKNLRYVVSNGHQTMAVINGPSDRNILSLLKRWQYESDEPNFTPRITASIFLGEASSDYYAEMATIRKSPKSESCHQISHRKLMEPGLGYCITTYSGNGNPLPSFSGTPYLLPLTGNQEEITETIWETLNEENRISLAVKFIDISTGKSRLNVMNKYSLVTV